MSRFWELYGNRLLLATAVHLGYVVVSVTLGFIIALTLGIALSRSPRVSKFVLPVISLFQTIPGIVFIGVLFVWVGMRPLTIIIALTAYAIFPVLKNTSTGLLGVSETYKEAARGCGMSPMQSLFRVELPLAMPAVFAGLRMSTIYITSWTVLATVIGQGGLGDFVYVGVATNNPTLIVAGAIPAAIMAIGLGRLIDWIRDRAIPAGMKGTLI